MNRRILFVLVILGVSSNVYANSGLADIEASLLKQDYQTVQELAQQMLSASPDDQNSDEVKYYLGLSYLQLGEYEQARRLFKQLLKVDSQPLRDKVYLGLFDSYYIEEDYIQALKVIKKLKKKSPQSEYLSLIYLKYARVNLKLSRWRKAQDYLKRIPAHFPDSLEAHIAKQLLEERRYFAVQVGAFIDRNRAEGLVLELKQRGEYAYIVETLDRQNRKFYRVRVGQLVRIREAQDLESKLSRVGYPTQIYP